MSGPAIRLLLAISVFAIGSLVSGAPYLEVPLPGGLPLGNLLAAAGLISAAAAALGLSRPASWLRRVSTVSVIATAAWLPVSIGLAGNLALNFGGSRGTVWIWVTLATALSVLCSLAFALATRLFARRSRHGSGAGSAG